VSAALKTKDELKQQRLDRVVEQSRERRKGLDGVNKTSVIVHKAAESKEADTTGSTIAGSEGAPTDEQLARINEFTLTPKTADELYVLNTMSANTLPDRDDDFFPKDTINGFNELPQPYSPVGKSYLVGHDHASLGVGRIFGSDTAEAEGTRFLTNEVYIPRTPQFEPFIESVDFGLNWAVSVGVLLEEQLCSICDAHQYGGWFIGGLCDNGHWKSAYYDPAQTEVDDWGYILEASPDDPKSVKCLGVMNGAKDFYELSQVFLGAQYFAQVGASKGVVKSIARTKGFSTTIPIIGLSAKEAEALPLPHTDPQVVEALQRFGVTHGSDGNLQWVDNNNLVWSYAPGDKVLCLGKQGDQIDENKEEDDDDTSSAPDGEVPGQQSEASSAGEGGAADAESSTVSDRSGDASGGAEDSGVGDEHPSQEGSDGQVTEDPDADEDESEEDEDDFTDEAVLVAASAAGIADEWLKGVRGSKKPLTMLMRSVGNQLSSLQARVEELEPKANLGEQYLDQLRADTIAAYVKAKGIGTQAGVDISHVQKLLDRFGDDADMIQELCTEYTSQVAGKLPRRSTAPTDPNKAESPAEMSAADHDQAPTSRARRPSTVTRLHR
jgi:hypothetical protein